MSRRDDAGAVVGVIATALLLAGSVALVAWNVATCTRWGSETEMVTDCWSTGSGYHTCTTRPVQRAVCEERRP